MKATFKNSSFRCYTKNSVSMLYLFKWFVSFACLLWQQTTDPQYPISEIHSPVDNVENIPIWAQVFITNDFREEGVGVCVRVKVCVCVCETKFSKGARSKDGMEWSPALTFAASVTECAVPPPLLLAVTTTAQSNGTDVTFKSQGPISSHANTVH